MKKILIPSLLVATLIAAGAVAFMPLDEVSTTHLPTISAGIPTDAVGTAQIAANAVTSAEIAVDTITAADIGPSAVDTSELAANAVTFAEIAVDTITAADIGPGEVQDSELADAIVLPTSLTVGTGGTVINAIITGAFTTNDASVDSNEVVPIVGITADSIVLFSWDVQAGATVTCSVGTIVVNVSFQLDCAGVIADGTAGQFIIIDP